MSIVKGFIVLVLFGWFAVTTIAVMGMPALEYKVQAWAIVAFGPVVVVAGLWEVCARIFGGRSK